MRAVLDAFDAVAEACRVDGDGRAGCELARRVDVDDAGQLMAGAHRLAHDERAVGAVVVVVQVRAADADVGHLDADLVGGRLRLRKLGDAEVTLAVED